VIEAVGLVKTFPGRGGILGHEPVRALRGVDFSIPGGGAVSFIGESGCGKTTLGKILTGLESYDSGTLAIDGQDVRRLTARRRRDAFRRIQMIHQDPYAALNPTRTVKQTLADPLKMRAREAGRDQRWIDGRSEELLRMVGLDPGFVLPRYPHMLSGGQRQRLVIARALTVDPDMLVADEAVSMIDVSLRLGILGLLRDLRRDLGIALLFITHDVATARYIGQNGDLYVIYRGRVVEHGPTDVVIETPVHPYTQCLLSAIPVMRGLEEPGPERVMPVSDEMAEETPCLFAPRCPFATGRCRTEVPLLSHAGGTPQEHACFYPAPRRVVPVDRPLPPVGAGRRG
jgi:oligopeptide/dipeptide ABC transporter ATP-binding protein